MVIKNHIVQNVKFDKLPHGPETIQPKYIVIHYSAGGSLQGSIDYLKSAGLSYHLLVDRDGKIVQGVPLNRRAWHSGTSNWKGLEDLNSHAIGICAANYGYLKSQNGAFYNTNPHQDPITPIFESNQVMVAPHKNGSPSEGYGWELYPRQQIDAIKQLCQLVLGSYTTIKDIIGHDDIAIGRKTDPGPAFPMKEFYPLVPQRKSDKGIARKVNSPDGALNVRRGPGSSYKVVATLNQGQKVFVFSNAYKYVNGVIVKSDWVSVDINGDLTQDGFVHRDFLR